MRRRLRLFTFRCVVWSEPRGNIDAEGFTMACDRHWCVRFQEARDSLAKLAHSNFDRGHGNLFAYTIAYAIVYMNGKLSWLARCLTFADSAAECLINSQPSPARRLSP